MTKVYRCWPADTYQDKTEIYNWCKETFGRGNVNEGWWSVTSHYDERPIRFDLENNLEHRPCPFLFTTNDPAKHFLFALRWS